ncbi:MAG: chorismate-binding protein [Candidatus Melainabacteria bacterium]|nr:MAG: chorismate-binding protein [Candidatus Melainabacteria bacterium]
MTIFVSIYFKTSKTNYNAFIKNEYETILSFSPELFFKIENNKIITKPMKGTIKRGKDKNRRFKKYKFFENR